MSDRTEIKTAIARELNGMLVQDRLGSHLLTAAEIDDYAQAILALASLLDHAA